jgi:hypothetical protein
LDEAVRPPDESPDESGRRLARNTQLVLRDEAHLGAVIDPAGGSWLVESLTHAVAERAWGLFQQIEGLGGMAAALASGHVQREVAAVAAERRKHLSPRPAPAALHGEPLTKRDVHAQGSAPSRPRFDVLVRAAAQGATLEQLERLLRPTARQRTAVEPLVRIRLAPELGADAPAVLHGIRTKVGVGP